MRNFISHNKILILVIVAICIPYFIGVASVPFHPDESTQIYMSSDFELFFKDIKSLYYTPTSNTDPKTTYRLLDAPLTRYIIGVGRTITQTDPLQNDWSWSSSWSENVANQSLPDNQQLLVSRYSASILFPFSLLLMFFIGKKIKGDWTGWVAMILFATNGLVLLHTRRAMAESALLFTLLLALWMLLYCYKNKWLIAIPISLAFLAKQTTSFLFPAGIFVLILPFREFFSQWKNMLKNIFLFITVSILIIFLFNPFLWKNPVQSIQAAVEARKGFSLRQSEEINQINPDQYLSNISERFIAIISQTFIAPPAFEDIGNYHEEIEPTAISYFNNPLNKLFRGFFYGGICAILSILGLTITIRNIRGLSHDSTILLISFALAFLTCFLFVLPFQRYYLILIPFICLFSAIAIDETRLIMSSFKSKTLH